jgi:hypothetical protein
MSAMMYGSGAFSDDTGNVLVQKPFFSPPKSNQVGGNGGGGGSSNGGGGGGNGGGSSSGGGCGGGGGNGSGGNGGGGLFGDMSLDGLTQMCDVCSSPPPLLFSCDLSGYIICPEM